MSSSETDLALASSDSVLDLGWNHDSMAADLDVIEEDVKTLSPENVVSETIASRQVGLSQDILPLILHNLKGILVTESQVWEKAVAPLLGVNQSFFQCGADLLWDTMESLGPAFKLLPWFKTCYTGIGGYEYSGSREWGRFNLYASRVKNFRLRSRTAVTMTTPWFMELFTLPGRPDQFFPALQSLEVNPDALEGPPCLFLFIGSRLRSLEVSANAGTKDNISSILPRLSISSPALRSLKYLGPASRDFLLGVSRLKTLTVLELRITSVGDRRWFRTLRELHLLQSLSIDAPALNVSLVPLMNELLPSYRSFKNLRSQKIRATEYQQCLVSRAIAPTRLNQLELVFLNTTDVMPVNLSIGLYLEANPIHTLIVAFEDLPPTSPSAVLRIPSSNRNEWRSSQGASDLCFSALRGSKDITTLQFSNTPFNIATSISPKILLAIACWERLTSLRFRVRLKDPEGAEPPTFFSAPPFPGLSFLASTVYRSCPNLDEMECHFDKTLVVEEDLSESRNACEIRMKEASVEGRPYPKDHHRLRKLCINTDTTTDESKKLELPVSRKIQISTFLDRLFPALEVVEGSDREGWSEIGAWVKSYQEQREQIVARVEDMFAEL